MAMSYTISIRMGIKLVTSKVKSQQEKQLLLFLLVLKFNE